jgi:VanZ family protein
MRPNFSFKWLIILAAWASLAAIAYATLARVGFVYSLYFKLYPILMQPEIRAYAHFEHVIAFAVFGALFCLAYSRHLVVVGCTVFGSATLLEILQTLTPDRRGTFIDAVEKIAGGAIGIMGAKTVCFSHSKDGPGETHVRSPVSFTA